MDTSSIRRVNRNPQGLLFSSEATFASLFAALPVIFGLGEGPLLAIIPIR